MQLRKRVFSGCETLFFLNKKSKSLRTYIPDKEYFNIDVVNELPHGQQNVLQLWASRSMKWMTPASTSQTEISHCEMKTMKLPKSTTSVGHASSALFHFLFDAFQLFTDLHKQTDYTTEQFTTQASTESMSSFADT